MNPLSVKMVDFKFLATRFQQQHLYLEFSARRRATTEPDATEPMTI